MVPGYEDLDGYSHLPFFVATHMDFTPAGVAHEGAYEYEFLHVDFQDQGWCVQVSFEIVAADEQAVRLPMLGR